jgi:biopolymer transport protein ExbD
MNDGFSISFVCVGVLVLLIMIVISMPPCGVGLPWLPDTDNPKNFGFKDQHRYPVLTIKADSNKFFGNDWISNMNQLPASIQTSNYLLIKADARLSFGEVRKTLEELKKYRISGIVLMSDKKINEKFRVAPCFCD